MSSWQKKAYFHKIVCLDFFLPIVNQKVRWSCRGWCLPRNTSYYTFKYFYNYIAFIVLYNVHFAEDTRTLSVLQALQSRRLHSRRRVLAWVLSRSQKTFDVETVIVWPENLAAQRWIYTSSSAVSVLMEGGKYRCISALTQIHVSWQLPKAFRKNVLFLLWIRFCLEGNLISKVFLKWERITDIPNNFGRVSKIFELGKWDRYWSRKTSDEMVLIIYLWFCLLNCLIKDAALPFKGKNVNYMCVISYKTVKIGRIF